MGTTVTKTDGKVLPMYREIGGVVIGLDEDYTTTITLNEKSLINALGVLGFIVIDPSDVTE